MCNSVWSGKLCSCRMCVSVFLHVSASCQDCRDNREANFYKSKQFPPSANWLPIPAGRTRKPKPSKKSAVHFGWQSVYEYQSSGILLFYYYSKAHSKNWLALSHSSLNLLHIWEPQKAKELNEKSVQFLYINTASLRLPLKTVNAILLYNTLKTCSLNNLYHFLGKKYIFYWALTYFKKTFFIYLLLIKQVPLLTHSNFLTHTLYREKSWRSISTIYSFNCC